MPVKDVLFSRLQLRTDPFAPTMDAAGAPIAPPVFTSELDPTRKPALLDYYFDVYDWRDSPLVGGLSAAEALEKFHLRKDYQPTLVVVSGTGRTGRGSLTNLILYKISQEHGEPPIRVDVRFNTYNRKQSLPQLAQEFITAYTVEEEKPTADQLNDAYDRAMTAIGDGTDFTSLFSNFRTLVRKFTQRPIVLRVHGVDHYDLWSSIYQMTSPLVDYIVVETRSESDARTLYNQLSGKGAVCHIRAAKMSREMLESWIARRLAAEQIVPGGAAPVSPLSDDALDALFEPGQANPGVGVAHAIGWVVETLQKAMAAHVKDLAPRGDAAVRTAALSELRIPAATVKRVRSPYRG